MSGAFIKPDNYPVMFNVPYVALLQDHIETLKQVGLSDDHDFVRGIKRTIEIIEAATPKPLVAKDLTREQLDKIKKNWW